MELGDRWGISSETGPCRRSYELEAFGGLHCPVPTRTLPPTDCWTTGECTLIYPQPIKSRPSYSQHLYNWVFILYIPPVLSSLCAPCVIWRQYLPIWFPSDLPLPVCEITFWFSCTISIVGLMWWGTPVRQTTLYIFSDIAIHCKYLQSTKICCYIGLFTCSDTNCRYSYTYVYIDMSLLYF